MDRISLEEWTARLDELLSIAIDRNSGSFQGIWFEKLYSVGCTPGDVVEALIETLCEAGVECVSGLSLN